MQSAAFRTFVVLAGSGISGAMLEMRSGGESSDWSCYGEENDAEQTPSRFPDTRQRRRVSGRVEIESTPCIEYHTRRRESLVRKAGPAG
ncbi:hypothetical protein F5Y15DRAFT_236430 [Xylariaceae sp. FL0016]|nr:hypothetical protein F5Y15DRAFT_236430 [Xylariaceae sp. FL0016]